MHGMTRSKRFTALLAFVDTKKAYAIHDAIAAVKKTANTRFDSTVELHCRLGIDPTKGEQQVRGTISLPHGTGTTRRVVAFVSGEKEKEAKEAGADQVGGEDLIDEIAQSGTIAFDVAVATPDFMPKLAKIAKILGPKGLMPNPKTDTVGTHVKKMVEELKKGKIAFKNDGTGNVHVTIGKASFDDAALLANAEAAIDALRRAKPASAKGTYFAHVTLTSTMGPGIMVKTE